MKSNRVVLLVVVLMLCSTFLVPVVWSAAKCPQGFGDCDGKPSTKCETNLMTSLAHCGRCGNACPTPPNSTATCTNGICGFTCLPGWGNCDGNAANGCETQLSSSQNNCGACGRVCGSVNATSYCSNGICGFSCNAGFGNCDGNSLNGCESNLRLDVRNCGACGKVCPAVANASVNCANSVCGFSCNAGFGNCDGNSLNGCESNLRLDVRNCGACGKVCPAVANASVNCANSVCGFSCNAGFGNCDGIAANGCESNLMTNAFSCGACGIKCSTGMVCVAGRCQ